MSLGSLFQCTTTLSVKSLFLTSSPNLPCRSLTPFLGTYRCSLERIRRKASSRKHDYTAPTLLQLPKGLACAQYAFCTQQPFLKPRELLRGCETKAQEPG